MSIIDVDLVHHPRVTKALDAANKAIGEWLEFGTCPQERESAKALLAGWTGVDLADRIACALLEAQGFDIDNIKHDLEHRAPGETVSDVFAAFDKETHARPQGQKDTN